MSDIFKKYIERNENTLKQLITQTSIPAPLLGECVNYALFPGGKKLRALLVYCCGDFLNIDVKILDILAASIELIHCYSLIHDDLPAMDNDDFRRGRPTCHKAFDEATAILVGDGLQNLAIDNLLTNLPLHITSEKTLHVAKILTKASGFSGMVSGQSLDLTELNSKITEEKLTYIHSLKTGQLFLACIQMLLIIAQNNPYSESLLKFGYNLGILYQMQDDYLDRYRNEQLGKNRASDLENHKTTFANIFSQTELEKLLNGYYLKAQKSLLDLGTRADNLLLFLDNLIITHTCCPEPQW